MDPASFGLSVAATVVLVDQVSTTLAEYISSVKGLRETRNKLQAEVQSLGEILKGLQSLVEDNRYGDEGTLTKVAQVNSGPLEQCEATLKELNDWLKDKLTTLRRLGFPLWRERRIKEALEAIQKQKGTFNLAIVAEIRQEQLNRKKWEREARYWKLIEWLSSRGGVDNQTKHQAITLLRQEGTCMWILDNKVFGAWKGSDRRLLWIRGIPGSGKTVLTSSIIDHFMEQADGSQHVVAYFYCDFRDGKTSSSSAIIRTLIAQLITPENPEAFEVLSKIKRPPNTYTDVSPPVAISELASILTTVLKTACKPILIIDALDECRDVTALLPYLMSLCREVDVRILVTGRDKQHIREGLPEPPVSSISLSEAISNVEADIRRYARSSLQNVCLDKDEEMRLRVAETLTKNARGMFHWAKCQVDTINRCVTQESINLALDDLPESLDETYERILVAIDGMKDDTKSIVQKMLWLVLGAIEPLSLSAMQNALAVEPNIFVENESVDVSAVLETCRNLLTCDEGGRVRFSHFSVQEFIASTRCAQSRVSHYHVTSGISTAHWAPLSLTYIQLACFDLADSFRSLESEPTSLYYYCAKHWNWYVENSPPTALNVILPLLMRLFLDPAAEKQRLYYFRHHNDPRSLRYGATSQECSNVAIICITYQLERLLDHILVGDPGLAIVDIGERWGTPLNLAARLGNRKIVTLLLDHGADKDATHYVKAFDHDRLPERQDKGHWNPLLLAVHNAHVDVVELLLEKGANPDVIGTPYNHSALHHCCTIERSVDPQLVRPLTLSSARDMPVRNLRVVMSKPQATAQSRSRERAGGDILSALLRSNPAVDAVDGEGRTPLHCAVSADYIDAARKLLEHGANVDARMKDGRTPIRLSKSEKMTQLLRERGAKETSSFDSDTDGDEPIATSAAPKEDS